MSYVKEKPETIRSLFDAIASHYTRGNFFLSFGLYRFWNYALIKDLPPSERYLDLCCGTGDIALLYHKKAKECHLLDFSKNMLEIAKKRAPATFYFYEADARNIPLEDKTIDLITVAYGIRNIPHFEDAIQEAFRVLKPGGTLAILELTKPENRFFRSLHSLFLKTYVPLAGKLITKNKKAYEYLADSIKTFIPPVQIQTALQKSGFENVKNRSLTFGTATLFFATKPSCIDVVGDGMDKLVY